MQTIKPSEQSEVVTDRPKRIRYQSQMLYSKLLLLFSPYLTLIHLTSPHFVSPHLIKSPQSQLQFSKASRIHSAKPSERARGVLCEKLIRRHR